MIKDYHIRFQGVYAPFAWETLTIKGIDAFDYYQRQSTNDLNVLNNLQGHVDCLLDEKGRLVSYFFVIKDTDTLVLVMPRELREATFERLNRFIVMEDVEINREQNGWQIGSGLQVKSKKPQGVTYTIFIAGEHFSLQESPKGHGEADEKSKAILSYLARQGVPLYRSQLINEIFNNTSLVNIALNLNKGCFLGQETVGKIESRRGAGLSKVILEKLSGQFVAGESVTFQKKRVGKLLDHIEENLYLADLAREFRVQGRIVETDRHHFKVHLIPFYRDNKYFDKAIELYDYALKIYTYEDRSEEAIELLKMAIDYNPNMADAYESLGVIYGNQGDYSSAVGLMKKLLEVEPNSVMAHTNLSLYYMKQGKIEEAENEKSLATVKSFGQFGKEAQEKKLKEEQAEKKRQELQRREGMFYEVLEIDGDDSMANCGLGEIFLEKKDYEKAIHYLEKTIDIDKKYSVAYLYLAKALLAQKELQRAKEVMQAGVSIAASQGDMMPANEMQGMLNRLN